MQRFIIFVLLVWLGLASFGASANVDTVTNTYTSSKPTAATVPSSVTISVGAASKTFATKAIDNTILDGPQSVVLSASASGYTTGTTVTDNESRAAAATFYPSQVTLSAAEASVSSQSVILTFSNALDENSATTVAHYAVDVNGAAVKVQSANYNAKTNTVTLLLPSGSLQDDDEVVVAWHELHSALEQIVTGQSPLFKAH
jgi:hypothetical protein